MLKNIILLVSSTLFLCSCAQARASSFHGDLTISVGAKALDQNIWMPVEKHGSVGAHLNLGTQSFPLDLVVGIVNSFDAATTKEGAKIENSSSEVRVGLQKSWRTPYGPKPFVAAGIANISTQLERRLDPIYEHDEASATGFWVKGGMLWTARKLFNFGVDAAYSSAEGEILNVSGNTGGFHFAFTIGLHFE